MKGAVRKRIRSQRHQFRDVTVPVLVQLMGDLAYCLMEKTPTGEDVELVDLDGLYSITIRRKAAVKEAAETL